ncbi:MAG TPA: hypothetical protein DCF63_19460, partial [Planctomycetaceae bacterium]|nr:hypothetical protein [Planctomycetaceae bacterium]
CDDSQQKVRQSGKSLLLADRRLYPFCPKFTGKSPQLSKKATGPSQGDIAILPAGVYTMALSVQHNGAGIILPLVTRLLARGALPFF